MSFARIFSTTRLTEEYHDQLVCWANVYRDKSPQTADAIDTFNRHFTGQPVTPDGGVAITSTCTD